MTTEEKLRCESECTRLCNDFIFNVDRRNYDELLELFVPNPVLDRTGTVYKGLDGLRTFLAGRPGDIYVRHTSSNIRVDMTGPRTAKGTSCATMFRATAQTDSGWKISRRKITVVFQP